MSTTGNLTMALTGARKAYDAYADYRDRKVSDAYDALASAAENYGPKADHAVESARELYDDSRAKAGEVTKAARVRLEKALEAAEKQSAVVVKDAKKSGKKLNRRARREAAKVERKVKGEKEGTRWFSRLAVTTLVVSGIAAAVYALTASRRKEQPGSTPPRVEVQLKKAVDQDAADAPEAGETVVVDPAEPKLVYSTVTPTGAEAESGDTVDEAPEVLDSEVPLDPETEEEILDEAADEAAEAAEAEDAIEAAAEAVQAEFDRKNAPRRADGEK